MISIQKTTRKDSPLILSFIKQLAVYEKLSQEVVATPELIEKYIFDEKKAECLFAYYENTPVGFALFFTNFSTFIARPGIYLEDLFVKPEYRGKGIGKALLLELVHIAKTRGYGRVEWAVLDWNEPAIKFYKSISAVPQDQWTVYRLTSNQFDPLLKNTDIN